MRLARIGQDILNESCESMVNLNLNGMFWNVATGFTTSKSVKAGINFPIDSHFFFIAGSPDAPGIDGSKAALPLTFSMLALRRRRVAF